MNLNDLKKNWDQFGKDDPYWAILTDPDKKGNKWDETAFFESGRMRTDTIAKKLKRLKPELKFDSALDFGCGAGRLTQGLANHFGKVAGVDIAASMIKLANEKNKKENCTYFLNEKDDLSLFKTGSFDLVFSEITLQHMQPKYAKKYITEFFRLLKPTGVAIFQIPSKSDKGIGEANTISSKLIRKTRGLLNSSKSNNEPPVMEMYWIPIEEMVLFLVKLGGQILEVRTNDHAGAEWDSYLYVVAKS